MLITLTAVAALAAACAVHITACVLDMLGAARPVDLEDV